MRSYARHEATSLKLNEKKLDSLSEVDNVPYYLDADASQHDHHICKINPDFSTCGLEFLNQTNLVAKSQCHSFDAIQVRIHEKILSRRHDI